MSILETVFSNIIGYDGLIFLLMLGNITVFVMAKKCIQNLYDAMHVIVYAPAAKQSVAKLGQELEEMDEKKLDRMRAEAAKWYTLYTTITGIFPLLGILGTVVSLLGMVGDTVDVTGGFFAALTSTFWGLVFAIVFKFMDSFISPKLEESERASEAFLMRKGDEEQK